MMFYTITAFPMMLTSWIGAGTRRFLFLYMSTDSTSHFDVKKKLKRGPLPYRFGAKKQDIYSEILFPAYVFCPIFSLKTPYKKLKPANPTKL